MVLLRDTTFDDGARADIDWSLLDWASHTKDICIPDIRFHGMLLWSMGARFFICCVFDTGIRKSSVETKLRITLVSAASLHMGTAPWMIVLESTILYSATGITALPPGTARVILLYLGVKANKVTAR